jgi:hypothetical protein
MGSCSFLKLKKDFDPALRCQAGTREGISAVRFLKAVEDSHHTLHTSILPPSCGTVEQRIQTHFELRDGEVRATHANTISAEKPGGNGGKVAGKAGGTTEEGGS